MLFLTYPEEIFEGIISHLSDDIPSLNHVHSFCISSTQSPFDSSSQLLNSIQIRAIEEIYPLHNLSASTKVLQEPLRAECLASAVKVLKISNGRPLFYVSEWDAYPDWVSKEPDRIGYFLRIMQNLQSLSIMQWLYKGVESSPYSGDFAQRYRAYHYE
ncbi:hypothetical protein BDQ17DRAFT_1432000 [Cyathus striatus]|nr:hypothetical protein BDQ17DRAFT_1432000 [Cyathus striatus]